MKTLAQFTNQYQVSKTLRFELKPVGKTEEWIKKHNIIGVESDKLVGIDAERAKHYKYAKRILDAMHRVFIEDALKLVNDEDVCSKLKNKLIELQAAGELIIDKELQGIFKNIFDSAANCWIEEYQREMPKFWKGDIKELELKIASENNNQRKKGFNSAIKAIQKKIKAPDKVIKKKNVDAMYSNEDALHLLEWKIRTEAVQLTFKELEQEDSDKLIPPGVLCEYLREFNKFSTYFSGFNENRQNVYDLSGTKSTSIINRTINENLAFHLANMEKWKTVKKSLENDEIVQKLHESNFDWQALLVEIETTLNCSFEQVFSIDSFLCFMNQSGINRYNEIIGGLPTPDSSEKIKGINEFINLCRQKSGAKRQQFPPMQELYKQILSKSDRSFIPEFSDDRDLLHAIENFHRDYFISLDENGKNLFMKFVGDMEQLADELADEFENLFLSVDKVAFISNILTGHWRNINDELLEILGEDKFNKRKYFSFSEIDKAVSGGCRLEHFSIGSQYVDSSLVACFIERFKELLRFAETSWTELCQSGVLQLDKLDSNRINEKDKGFMQVALIKTFLDAAIELAGFVRVWQANKEILKNDNRSRIWYDQLDEFVTKFQVIKLYNMVRNYICKKPSATEKLKINFENATLLDGWDRNKESSNYGVLLEKEGNYYLAVMTPKSNKIFDYDELAEDSKTKAEEKFECRKNILVSRSEDCYRKINYKQIASVGKDIFTLCWDDTKNTAVRKTKNRESVWGKEITRIKESKSYQNNERDRLTYFSYLLKCAKSYWKHFALELKEAEDYESLSELLSSIGNQGYSISFDNIRETYVEDKVNNGELYLFKIYNKDFSSNKKAKGTDNLHTIYWKGLFAPENLENTVLKLNGQAEVFFRQASVKYCPEKLKTGHHIEELKGKFNYPIIKDKRFTENKFFFHCPITLNFGAAGIPGSFNNKIRDFLKDNPDVNIIGIDRGEKHLLYYSVINQNGKVVEQGSLNEISNGFIPRGENSEREINYQAKLDAVEKKRDAARKSWSMIESIKELKAGYLSQVVHQLAKLIVKHNAIVVLEDLSGGFKRGRFGVEKQVYQKFEKALIDKLNYLVFKDAGDSKDPGGHLNAYQLTNKFESFQKMGKQSGILFYTTASYTSATDPVSGFLKNIYTKYQSVEKSIEFWKSFDSIIYNREKDRFEFKYTLGKVTSKRADKEKGEDALSKKTWTVCSCVMRSRYVKPEEQSEDLKQNTTNEQIGNKGRHETFYVTDKIKKVLDDANVDYTVNADIKTQLAQQTEKNTHSSMLYLFNAILNMRVTDPNRDSGSNENDFILSPVEPFFDSREKYAGLPENGDANGAYNIARKGICILDNINKADDVNKAAVAISKQQWQEFAQSEEVVKRQIEKMRQ